MAATKLNLFDRAIITRAAGDAFRKLGPRHMVRNPVMFVVLVGSVLTTLVLIRDVVGRRGSAGFDLQIALWLWFTVLFANFAEAMAEGRGKAQADALRRSRQETRARRLRDPRNQHGVRGSLRHLAQGGGSRHRDPGRAHPRRRHRGRGGGLGGRIGHHRRIGPGHPGGRR